ncbi:hypothetical protein [Virgisporangium aurantiacum]|uniref:Uncharacterized protein n=1 Tax=Virgisporangium aurantiacum TaxID=175570 RepID=A0A8J3ZC89_9ACTN|nr:hypothetical protein [Virgisporangium aurantiacum]GIJ61306.1 hypothetical protein Vau01_088220 [Virgisporangium aurantiacum]
MVVQELASMRAEALFVSDVQRSDPLTADLVREAVSQNVRRYGPRGLAARVAEEYGEHPECAVGRMSWCLGTVELAYA